MSKSALVVGINYVGTGSDLGGCIQDAADWKEVFEARGFEVTSLLEKDATKANIIAALKEHVTKLTYGDILAFQYSGHGSWQPDESGDEADGRDECLCPIDVFSGNTIVDDELHEVFVERARGSRICFLSDSCHSGSISKFMRAPPQEIQTARVRFMPPTAFSEVADVRGLRSTGTIGSAASLLISGCKDDEFSWDSVFGGKPNGAFTRAAIDSLNEIHNPASYFDWWKKIRTKLPTASTPQSPLLSGPKHSKKWQCLEEGR